MTPLVMLFTRDEEGVVRHLPIVRKDGNLTAVIEELADYIVVHGLECPTWELIAAERQRELLKKMELLDEANALLKTQRALIEKLKAAVIPGALAQ